MGAVQPARTMGRLAMLENRRKEGGNRGVNWNRKGGGGILYFKEKNTVSGIEQEKEIRRGW